MKRQRILTNRNFSDGKSYEAIEKDDHSFYWRAVDYSLYGSEAPVEVCFPVDEWFVIKKFAEIGREYRRAT